MYLFYPNWRALTILQSCPSNKQKQDSFSGLVVGIAGCFFFLLLLLLVLLLLVRLHDQSSSGDEVDGLLLFSHCDDCFFI